MAQERFYVGLDVGGTTMKAAVVSHSGSVYPDISLPTRPERGQQAGLETMAEAIRRATAAAKLAPDDITAVGVATPGLMDIKKGLILDPPNLKPWRDVPVREYIRQTLNKPTAFQNDANAAALGEFWLGAGKEFGSLCLFTLGTGVGGGIILGEQVLEGEHSHGGEIGHLRIELPKTGRLCGCGRRGCLEAYGSATAVVARAREAARDRPGETVLGGLLNGGDEEVGSKLVFDAAAAGDPVAATVVEETAYYLALGACAMIAAVDPALICFGGGMTAAGDAFLGRIRHYVGEYGLDYPASKVAIRYAILGSNAGFIGAAGCARLLAA